MIRSSSMIWDDLQWKKNIDCLNTESVKEALIYLFDLWLLEYFLSYRYFVLHFQNPATFCLFQGFESQIVYVISDVMFVFALLLVAENSRDYSVSWGISVFKPCWQLSPEKIQCMKERSVKEKTRDSDWKKDVCKCLYVICS